MKKHNVILALIFLLLITQRVYSQQEGKRISHTTLSIYNNSNKDLKIQLGLDTGHFQNYSIVSQEKWLSPTFPLNARPLFVIKTDNREVKYTLKLNSTYMIFWNNKKKYWDLKKIKNPA
jgi:hypothetical protein